VSRSSGFSVQNQFKRGLLTEATGYNFPEDAATDTENCVFEKTGEVRRRLGIDFEDGYEINDAYGSGGAISEYIWKRVGEEGKKSFVVIQLGTEVNFYEVDDEGNVGTNHKDFSVNLETYRVAGAPGTELGICQFASGFGYLFIVHPYCDPVKVEYNFDTDTITKEVITVEIRDLEGVDDGLGVSTRPTTLSIEHKYNLFNQSWHNGCAANAQDIDPGFVPSKIDFWHLVRSNSKYYESPAVNDYPSNCDMWWYYKDAKNNFWPAHADRFEIGNTPAPKGHFILYAFNQQRESTVEADYAINRHAGVNPEDRIWNFPGVADNFTSGYSRPSTVAFYAGRVWYSGVQHNKFTQNIYYSQVIENDENFGKCFSHNDPVAEDFSDLLDTDGGFIKIAEAAEIIKLIPVRDQLLVMCTNGIWMIGGGAGAGFIATDYSINKLSDVPVVSPLNVVIVEGMPQWWNYDGIYGLFPGEAGTSFGVRSLSDETIRTYFLKEVPAHNRAYAKGAYNPVLKIIQWIWRSTDIVEYDDNFAYDRVLNLNILTGAFYPWTLNDDDVDLAGIFTIDNTVGLTATEAVTDNSGNAVVDASAVAVTVTTITNSATVSKFKYILNVDAV
jgi:hypothetical protein